MNNKINKEDMVSILPTNELTLEQQKSICNRFLSSKFGKLFKEREWVKLSMSHFSYGSFKDVKSIHFALEMDIENSERISLCTLVQSELDYYDNSDIDLSEDEIEDIFYKVFLSWEVDIRSCITTILPDACEAISLSYENVTEYCDRHNARDIDILLCEYRPSH